ncbi:hypothetical protein OCU04_010012 [Sclerotinia nivalis]|uniref:Uncharacterized protein n=1 Tax=Sclerotinia nivalis TaxID=352851 RepID=A0A9X0DGL6_9HELO|nr:hypothetical protein OCU04_010012 [Sclerotinia nivalis]
MTNKRIASTVVLSRLFSRLRRITNPRRAEETIYEELDDDDSKTISASKSIGITKETEKNDWNDEALHRKEFLQSYEIKGYYIRATFHFESFQRQLSLLKQRKPAEKSCPSLRKANELKYDAMIKGGLRFMDEEEIKCELRGIQITREFWYAYDPGLQSTGSRLHKGIGLTRAWYQQHDEPIMEGRKAEIKRRLEETIKERKIVNDEFPWLSIRNPLISEMRYRYLRGLIEQRKIEIQLLEEQLEEEKGKEVVIVPQM